MENKEVEAGIINHFGKFIKISDSLRAELLKRFSVVSFDKGEMIIDADRVCTKSYYLLSGLARTYFIKDGREICEYFSTENEWANSPRSWRIGKTDIYFVDAIEDIIALKINVDDMRFLFDNYPELNKYGRLGMVTILDQLIERITSFRFTTAKEKYDHFKQTYPKVYHRIPLGMAASYMGISQETLSRLRAKK